MITSGQIAISSASPTIIFTATGRTRLRTRNGVTTTILLGDSSVAFPDTGWPCGYDPVNGFGQDFAEREFHLEAGDSLYGIAATGSPVVQFVAEY